MKSNNELMLDQFETKLRNKMRFNDSPNNYGKIFTISEAIKPVSSIVNTIFKIEKLREEQVWTEEGVDMSQDILQVEDMDSNGQKEVLDRLWSVYDNCETLDGPKLLEVINKIYKLYKTTLKYEKLEV